MELKDFAISQDLSEEQAKKLELAAMSLTRADIIVEPAQLYKSLMADNAVLSVADAAKVLSVTTHYVHLLGKEGKIQIDGTHRVHRVEYKSLLNFMLKRKIRKKKKT